MNSASTISENIGHKISKANDQLGASVILPVHKKILLLKNQWWGGNNPKDFREALAGYYDVLLSCQNIDEIWLQFNNRDGEILHELIYTRDFITSYNKGRISITPQNTELFRKWFYYLSQQGDTMKSLLFTNMKSIISSKKPDSIFSDNQSREMMVKLGEWLAEKDRYDDLIWIIEKFIDDSDPPDPNNYNVESELDFHRQIENGEDPVTINTVLGQLAWVILKLSLKKEYIKKALNFTNILLSHNNLYVKYQALFPLMEISARRQWLDGYGKRPYEGSYKEFHDIVFGILSLLETHPKYVAISSHFVEIFSYYKDLTTEEALRVVKVLKNTETSASLFIYFAMFRERHYKDQNMDFDSSPFVVELDSILAGTDDEFRALRVNIAWNLWKLLSEEPNEFPNVKKFIDILVSRQPYSRDLFTNMEMIIEDHVSTHPDECINWFDNMLDKIELYMSSNVDDQRGVWLSCSEKVIEEIAKRGNANRLVDVISKLIKLWEKGAYIGQIDQLFLSFKLIPESEKQDVKNQFKRIYKRMKEGQPKLTDVAWD